MEQLNNEIRALQDKNVLWETQLTELLRKRRIEELDADQKQELADDIKSVRKTISDNNDQILEKEKQITADKQKEAADKQKEAADKQKEAADKKTAIEIEKARQITADKQYRLERGETTASPITLYLFSFIKLSSVSCSHPP